MVISKELAILFINMDLTMRTGGIISEGGSAGKALFDFEDSNHSEGHKDHFHVMNFNPDHIKLHNPVIIKSKSIKQIIIATFGNKI